VLLAAMAGQASAATSTATQSPYPIPYNWSKFPAAWFGANNTNFESEQELEAIGKYSLAIFGWQALITATNWTASIYAQLAQAGILKAKYPDLPVYVYSGFGNSDGYDAPTFEIIRSASDGCSGHQPCRKVAEPYTDWVLETDTTPVYSMSACEQMGMGYSNPPTDHCWNPIWNLANESMRDFFIDKLVTPLAEAPTIDGVFYDCFNFAYQLPDPWGRKATNIPNCTTAGGPGCEALLNGTIDLARRIAVKLNAGGKVAMFSNPATFANPTKAPIWLDEQRLVDGLKGTSYQFNYEFFRAEQAATDFQLPNLLKESNLGVPIGMHTYLNNMTEDPTPHLAAFMIFRQQHWYSFSSTGWLDNDWEWQPIYDKLSECGNPVDVKPVGAPAPLVYTRKYQHCAFKLDCSNPKPKSCVTSIKWSATGEVSNYPAVGATQGLAPAHGRAYYEQLHQQELHSSN